MSEPAPVVGRGFTFEDLRQGFRSQALQKLFVVLRMVRMNAEVILGMLLEACSGSNANAGTQPRTQRGVVAGHGSYSPRGENLTPIVPGERGKCKSPCFGRRAVRSGPLPP